MLRPGILVAAVMLIACEGKKPEGLPPAKDWQTPPGGAAVGSMVPPVSGGGRIDPHAGVAGAPPLGGSGGGDPHAGIPGAPSAGGGGADVADLGLPAPDPNRAIDPSNVLSGSIALGGAHVGKVPPGSIVFLAVRAADPATGQGVGMPIATDKLIVGNTWPIAFKLDESKAMIGGTGFTGDVVIVARFDQDGEARSKQPGDITGQVRTKIPATDLRIALEQMLP